MRLVGASFEGRSNRLTDSDFAAVLREAVALLRGEGLTPDNSDDRRERVSPKMSASSASLPSETTTRTSMRLLERPSNSSVVLKRTTRPVLCI